MGDKLPETCFILLALLATAGCAGMKMGGECSYVREIKTTYACERDGTIEHYKIEPAQD